MKPAMVPVAKIPHALWVELKYMHDHPNSAFEKPQKPKEKRKKYRIYRMVLIEEFRATEAVAQKKLDSISAGQKRKGVIYWLDEVVSKRRKPIRC